MPSGQTRATVEAKHGKEHHKGFDDALELALSQLSKDVGTGKYTVKVEFEAQVEVSNPGIIGWYTVKLSG